MISIVRLMPAHSNIDPILMMDAARRRLNYLGPLGFRAMAGQTDDLFRKQGYLEFPLASPQFLVGSGKLKKSAATH
jgi:hypothetical protein